MMRKVLATILSVSMIIGMAACGGKDDKKNNTPADSNEITATVAPTAPAEDKAAVVTPEVAENTAGSALWNSFLETMKANPEASAIDIANTLSTNPVIQFMAMASESEPGYLAGFSEEITGFESGASYGPMIGSIAFIGHIFKLADGSDVNAFIANLKSKADPRWNICVAADYTQVGAYENTVYFLMYPASMDEDSNAGENGGSESENPAEAVVIRPEVEENTWGELLWNTFEAVMA